MRARFVLRVAVACAVALVVGAGVLVGVAEANDMPPPPPGLPNVTTCNAQYTAARQNAIDTFRSTISMLLQNADPNLPAQALIALGALADGLNAARDSYAGCLTQAIGGPLAGPNATKHHHSRHHHGGRTSSTDCFATFDSAVAKAEQTENSALGITMAKRHNRHHSAKPSTPSAAVNTFNSSAESAAHNLVSCVGG